MKFKNLPRLTGKFVSDNSPAILTGIGVVGVVATAYFTGRATFRAAEVLEKEEDRRNAFETRGPITPRDKIELLWKLYIPAVSTGTFTIAAIIFANRIGTRRTAALASAFAISERAMSEYQEKVVEKLGEKDEQKIRDEVAIDRVARQPVSQEHVFSANGGDVLCMDAYSGRYFTSDMETLHQVRNEVNHTVLNHGYASLTDFYSLLGLAGTAESDNVGWNSDKLLELNITTTVSDTNRPCFVVNFGVAPVRNFFRAH